MSRTIDDLKAEIVRLRAELAAAQTPTTKQRTRTVYSEPVCGFRELAFTPETTTCGRHIWDSPVKSDYPGDITCPNCLKHL